MIGGRARRRRRRRAAQCRGPLPPTMGVAASGEEALVIARLLDRQGLLRDAQRLEGVDHHRQFGGLALPDAPLVRSEEHTSELQSRENLVCRLLLEKKKK